jgi:iron(III) transport system ATP-binding protein
MHDTPQNRVRVVNVSKRFQATEGVVAAVRNLDLDVQPGEFFVLLGPSGCGKTTLLRSIAGLERHDEGEIYLGERLLSSGTSRTFVEPEDREIAMVFQSYAIWPHMTVFGNVAYPLTEAKKRTRLSREEVRTRVERVLSLVGLEARQRDSAATLSGGQQQRVALARALVREPKLLLMDEPLSNLDAKLREEMRLEIKELTRATGVTTIHVTHDQIEAMAVADRIAVMSKGRIVEIGPPEDLYRRPKHRITAEFVGHMNWLDATATSAGAAEWQAQPLRFERGSFATGTAVSVGVRPDWVVLRGDAATGSSPANAFTGRVVSRLFLGETALYRVAVGQSSLLVRSEETFAVDDRVRVEIPPDRCVVFAASEALEAS